MPNFSRSVIPYQMSAEVGQRVSVVLSVNGVGDERYTNFTLLNYDRFFEVAQIVRGVPKI